MSDAEMKKATTLFLAGQGRIRNDTLKANLEKGGQKPEDLPADQKQKSSPMSKKAENKVMELVEKSSQVLLSIKTVFPFDFFPDTLTITSNKIDIVKSQFFFSAQTTSIPIRDIARVEIETSPFFAKIQIINLRYPMEPIEMQYLWKNEATKAKNIIDGLLVAMSQGADVSAIEPKDMIPELEQVGESASPQ